MLVRLLLVLLAAVATPVFAQYPDHPPKILVPFPPGGAADTFARLAADRLGAAWGKQMIVENRPGAGGIIATEATAKAPPDGYTFLIVTVGHAVNPSLYAKLPYDTLGDFAPVAMVANVPNVLVVHPSVPVNSVQELIALAKKSPGSLKYASSGNATTSHMAAALLSNLAGIEMLHVPYKGAAPAVQDLVAGRVDLMLDPTVSSGAFVKQGRLRALAVTTAKRTPILPELPTIAEAGVPGYEFSAWFLLLAPAKTPAEPIAKVNGDLAKLASDAGYKERLAALGAEPAAPLSSAQVGEFIAAEMKRWAKVVKDANIKVE
ncbi:MAG TPA: tripartite tricarboxylate transporter substrate binding protein [Burkholderiales bacterium]|nr:tripartite tricarboxylate transporter substrate binding protein [Burkholderiales bacterium]